MRKNIIAKHTGMKREFLTECEQINSKEYSFNTQQVIDYNEDEIIITAAVKMNINDPICKKYLENMEDKQSSPIKEILGKIEREYRHNCKYEENATTPLYKIPEDIAHKYGYETIEDIISKK